MSRPNEDEIVGAIVLAILLIVFTVIVKIVNHSDYTKDNDPTMQPTSITNGVLQPSNQTHNNSVLIPKFNQEKSAGITYQEISERKQEKRKVNSEHSFSVIPADAGIQELPYLRLQNQTKTIE